jgi:hypothetical protein
MRRTVPLALLSTCLWLATSCLDNDDRAGDGVAGGGGSGGESQGEGEGEGAPSVEGEGEGSATEGEGRVVEGEGEGPAAEGEGEGPANEGEGEGQVGEGEGEPAQFTCGETLDCLEGCGRNQGCRNRCANRATDNAKRAIANMRGCEWMTCDSDDDCNRERCAEFGQACRAEEHHGLTCVGIYACYSLYCQTDDGTNPDCSTPLCWDGGSDEAVALIGSVNACAAEACGGRRGDAYQLCVADRCGDIWAECRLRPTEPVSCRGIVDCLDACPDDDRDCKRWCEDAARETALEGWDELVDCLEEAECELEDWDCAVDRCPEAFVDCAPGCLGIGLCRANCERESCRGRCRRDAPHSARDRFDEYDDCLFEHNCDEGDAECAPDACPELTQECAPWLMGQEPPPQ